MKSLSRLLTALSVLMAVTALTLAVWTFLGRPRVGPAPPPGQDRELILSISSYSEIVRKVAPSVVNIYATRFIKEQVHSAFMNDPVLRQFVAAQFPEGGTERIRREQSVGSGVIVSSNGFILTAGHVIANADEIKVSVPGTKKEYTAGLIGRDRLTDLAVLKIEDANLRAIEMADSEGIEVGDVVLAIGNPYGVGQAVSMGIISGLDRSGRGGYENYIQIDAAIYPGNSGGALVDARGRLIGVNTIASKIVAGNQGIGFAIPVNLARNIIERFASGGKITRGDLGIIPQDITTSLARIFRLPNQNGALVGDAIAGSPAQKAGIQSGDVIVAVNDKDVTDAHNLQFLVSQLSAGSDATFRIIRNGNPISIPVTLGELLGASAAPEKTTNAPPEPPRIDALDGVSVSDIDQRVRQQLRIPETVQGAIVTQVVIVSNAAKAGLQKGDVIVEINRQPVAGTADAVRIGRAARSQELLLKVWRNASDGIGTRYLSVDNLKRPK